MKFRRIPCLSLLLLALTAQAQANNFHLVTESFPPLNMTNNGTSFARNDRVSGFATDIMRKLFESSGYTTEFTLMSDWDKAFNSAKDKPAYGVYSAFRTPEREEHFQWVGPLYHEDWVILALADSDISVSSLADLKNFKVGSYEYDGISDYLIEQQVNMEQAKSDALNVVKLKLGKIQLWASSSLTGPYVASNFRVPVKSVFKINESSLWLAMYKDTDPAVVEKLNNQLKLMHESGEIQQLIASYNG
ncbi:substrate-binding periplasmic protein [Endozoicomonas ascidiicola]|uniref:substrate-binding periplasmic protein n=1 Tax=Endozoicomonas ascidiicola TaxID=1698521 RepID=UPI00083019C2|nr:ABC transporter substrate-binding protein [Endozoicomonas ascidiicola]